MDAILLLNDKLVMTEGMFVEMVIWQVPEPVRGSTHSYKYRLALIVDGVCVLRFDNEAGKGDHRHDGGQQVPYDFTNLTALQTDFWDGVAGWKRT
jgi:hypothetical protein